MLKPAQLYTDEIQKAFWNVAYLDDYKYYSGRYASTKKLSDNNQYQHEFVSINSNNELAGFISYSINAEARYVSSFGAINFSKEFVFVQDLMSAIDDIFCKYNFRKIVFSVICGNPIEKSYDKLVLQYGGRIVGFMTDDEIIDGIYYNTKLYEIMREDYLLRRPNKFKQR